jgi:putative tryptophan/tyrosine transport system substrate-binding protein
LRRRDFTIGLLLATAAQSVPAQEPAQRHRVAIVIASGPATRVDDPTSGYWQAFWAELRRFGDIEGQNLTVERYSAEGRPEAYADLASDVVKRNPDAIVAISGPMSQTVSAATATIPIIASGFDPEHFPNMARPSGNVTGITVNVGSEINGKRLQILKEAVPSASKVAVLDMRAQWEGSEGKQFREPGQRLAIPLVPLLLDQATSSEVQRVFAQIAQQRPDAIIVSDISELVPHRQLIVELVERNRLPAMYPIRLWVEAGGLMAYGADYAELWRRLADDVHEILNGTKPGDIPIYQPTKFEFLVNLNAAKALGLSLPPTLLARADEVIE